MRPTGRQVIEVYMPFRVKELDYGIWDFKGKEGNSQEGEKG